MAVSKPSELIAQGFLVEPRVLTVPPSALPDLSTVRVKGGDYDEKSLAGALDDARLVGDIVKHWSEHAGGVRTVAFAVSVKHSQHIVERFRGAGVAAEHLDGSTPAPERDAILARLASGETRVVSNVGVCTEGWDCPSVKCAILARPTKSLGLYLQQAGRILRPYNDQKAIILDHAGCAMEHGLPQDDRSFSLTLTPQRKNLCDGPPAKTCERCHAVLALAVRICPECGFVFVVDQMPTERDGELVEVPSDPASRKRAEWDRLTAVAQRKGYKPGWVYYRYREFFGEEPPASFSLQPNITRAVTALMHDAARLRGGTVTWDEIDRAL